MIGFSANIFSQIFVSRWKSGKDFFARFQAFRSAEIEARRNYGLTLFLITRRPISVTKAFVNFLQPALIQVESSQANLPIEAVGRLKGCELLGLNIRAGLTIQGPLAGV